MATKFFNSLGKDINKAIVKPAEKGFNKTIAKPAEKMFKKSTGGASLKMFIKSGGCAKLFGKGSIGSKVLGDISRDLEKGADVLDVAHKYGTQILNNPAVRAFVATQPELQPLYAGALAVNTGLGIGAKGAHQVSGLTKQKNYHGNAKQVVGQVLQRSKGLAKTGMEGANLYNQYA
jgi:hypothetical protein